MVGKCLGSEMSGRETSGRETSGRETSWNPQWLGAKSCLNSYQSHPLLLMFPGRNISRWMDLFSDYITDFSQGNMKVIMIFKKLIF